MTDAQTSTSVEETLDNRTRLMINTDNSVVPVPVVRILLVTTFVKLWFLEFLTPLCFQTQNDKTHRPRAKSSPHLWSRGKTCMVYDVIL